VLGDPLRLRQILANLLSNAVKFTESGSITVAVRALEQSDDKVTLEFKVRDTGVGIPADKQLQVFEKFTQADSSISRRFGGTGLGLAITLRLVEMHSGQITLDSREGEGSTFTVVLPYKIGSISRSDGVAPEQPLPAANDTAGKLRVLLVEDNLVNQRIVSVILRKRGFIVDIANNGSEALAMMEQHEYQLVLMDVQMPVLDGLEATRHIRANPAWAQLPIIAMTAHAMNGDREDCMSAGMNGYISKPIHPDHLMSLVEELVVQTR
jgi:CheY-like chemotaxis protein